MGKQPYYSSYSPWGMIAFAFFVFAAGILWGWSSTKDRANTGFVAPRISATTAGVSRE
jgi:F0F1-type ATP synthase assembly protein I